MILALTALAALGLAAWLYLVFLRHGFWRAAERLPHAPAPQAWPAVAVVVPARDEAQTIAATIAALLAQDYPGPLTITLVDDGSSDGTGDVARDVGDDRVQVIRHGTPRGVGGATIAGMKAALADHCDVVVKVDGDGQMDPGQLPALLDPLVGDGYGYAKGNRFLRPDALRQMPRVRLVGNFLLTFLTKLASGYWRIFDPQNGYVAARGEVLAQLDLDRLAHGYFFENDMLIHLNVINVRVRDVPMPAHYGDERSSMRINHILTTFPVYLFRGFWFRIYEKYILRDFSPIGVFWCLGAPLMAAGAAFGGLTWIRSLASGHPATTGTVMLSVLPFLIGFELILQAIILEIRESPS